MVDVINTVSNVVRGEIKRGRLLTYSFLYTNHVSVVGCYISNIRIPGNINILEYYSRSPCREANIHRCTILHAYAKQDRYSLGTSPLISPPLGSLGVCHMH